VCNGRVMTKDGNTSDGLCICSWKRTSAIRAVRFTMRYDAVKRWSACCVSSL